MGSFFRESHGDVFLARECHEKKRSDLHLHAACPLGASHTTVSRARATPADGGRPPSSRSALQLLLDGTTRKLHMAWAKWMEIVHDERIREAKEAHHRDLTKKHKQMRYAALLGLLVQREGSYKRLAYHQWMRAAFGLREAAVLEAHSAQMEARRR